MVRERTQDGSCPADRCGFTVEYLDQEFWSRGDVTCWRPVYENSQRCIWHAKIDNKPLEELRNTNPGERLDGSYLPDIRFGDLPLVSDHCLDYGMLSEFDAVDADLSGASFNLADLSGSNFAHANLQEAELRGTVLADSTFAHTNLKSAHLREACLSNVDITDATVSNSSLPGASFQSCEIAEADFTGSYFEEAEFVGSVIESVEFEGSEMEECTFTDSTIRGTNLNHLTGRPPAFRKCKISDCDFSCSDFSHAVFEDVRLVDTEFVNIDGLNAHFRDSTALYCDFSDSYLKSADFPGLKGSNSDFSGTDCSRADFSGANLEDSTFVDANLRGGNATNTDFEAANLERVDLRNTRLDGCKLGETVLQDVTVNEDTSLGEQGYGDRGREKSIRAYRKFQRLLRENSLDEQVHIYRIREKDLRRRQALEDSRYYKWLMLLTLSGSSRYGESPLRVLGASAVTIILLSVLYAATGDVSSAPFESGAISSIAAFPIERFVFAAFEQGIRSFFGMNLVRVQTTYVAEWIHLFGNVIGTLFFTLFVFTLGRVATR